MELYDGVAPLWGFVAGILPTLLKATGVTLKLTVLAMCVGLAIGTLAALMRISRNRLLSSLSLAYVTFFRGTPLVVQILIIYFALPQIGVKLDRFWSAVVALGINAGAYIAEIIRAAIESIDKGQMEAARSLGMSYGLAMRRVIIPQTYRRLLPPLGNEFIAMLKDTSLIALIGGEELTRAGQHIISATFRPWPVYLTVAGIYLSLTALFSCLVRFGERRLQQ
ncbi:MAG: amino acid ABC transporter permease [Candidatus Fermentithermobacillus carboniphilus]|uniref:Amino acid ABC transporter permease n=1 Tax=Candidatus Fermentithermobacillus carboniphilus TaxID=3085328 RepID=A0AAT9LF78_9FIRM|nr:MAG: amino acid ABC transporter permease [Candidatus Fermentithermobacillus carboniphilus]